MRSMPIARQIILGLLAFLGIAGAVIYPRTAAAISLNENALIEDNVIRLGDIFNGLPKDSEKPLGPAPLPGKQMTIDARTLLRIAVALDLPWRPQTSADFVTVRRAAQIVEDEAILGALKLELEKKGVTGDYVIAFDQPAGQMVLPQSAVRGVEVISVNVRPEKNWFEADLAAPSKDNPLVTAHVSGRVERMTRIPVLRENLRNGTIIGERDIDFIRAPEKNIKANMILRPEDLIGMTPRQIALAGQPVNANEIEAPRIIQRGDAVTMVFNQGGLHLTAQGKALEHGAKGDRIRISNISSSRTILAQVTGEKEVTLIE